MPPLAMVEIPVCSRSPSAEEDQTVKVASSLIKARTYSEEPLPVMPSGNAPRNARILNREIDHRGAFYRLQIGDVEINDVGIDEILEYVSAQHLEDYENEQFAMEAELLRIAEAEEERRREERRLYQKERAKRKGIVIYEELQQSTGDSADPESAAGRHGRARPTYKHLFKQPKERRRRKRDPVTGELMPLSDDECVNTVPDSSEDDQVGSARPSRSVAPLVELPKRRRRKRDPVTGELMPLQSAAQLVQPVQPAVFDKKKRPRRKRHPQTGELMPLGWRYNPDAPNDRSTSSKPEYGLGAMSPAMGRLTLSQEHDAKRVKLRHQSSSGDTSSEITKPRVIVGSDVSSETSSDDGNEEGPVPVAQTNTSKTLPVPNVARDQLSNKPAIAAGHDDSPKRRTTTSIMKPTISVPTSAEASEEDDIDDDEWVIEAILAHHMSDPRTHAAELGKTPVMLYQVKWEGFEEPTWEPISSFADRSLVNEYHEQFDRAAYRDAQRVPQKHDVVAGESGNNVSNSPSLQSNSRGKKALAEVVMTENDDPMSIDEDEDDEADEDEEDSYEIEGILSHHFSDPRTHGPDFGKEPVMLYQVKWKGYADPTWEPLTSFQDRDVVHQYRQKAGLPRLQ